MAELNPIESVYDVFNHRFLGEITENAPMGRWSVGYYQANGYYHVAYTEGNMTRNEVHYHAKDKEKALKLYHDLAEKYSFIAQKIKENVGKGISLPNEELKKLYLRFSVEYSSRKSQIEREYKATEATRRFELSQTVEARKSNSYVDYVATYCYKILPVVKERTDYVWLSEDGTVILEGRVGFENVIYLISCKIDLIREYFAKIKTLICAYCEKNEGHYLDDIDRTNIEIFYYSKLKSGYIEKKVSINNLTYQDILGMYNDALKKHEFPTKREIQEIKRKIDSSLDYMDRAHGGY